MVLKEYLLRGMVESVLVLTPASLVGQWREELETKFDIACATTHDALLRSDPERFWKPEAPDRFARAGAPERACRPHRRPQLRSRHRGRGPPPARPHEPELQAGGRAQQALPAPAVGDAGAERSHRALQRAHAAQAGHLQDAEGVSRRLCDARQAAPAGQSRAPARADARRHGAQHARGRRAEAAAPSRRDDPRGWLRRASGRPTRSSRRRRAGWRREGGKPARAAASSRRRRIVSGRGRRGGAALRRPPCRCGLAGAGAALGLDRHRRQGGGADRPAAAESGREEAGLRPLPRDARSSRRPAGTGGLRLRALRGRAERPRQGRRHRRVPRAGAGAPLHRIRAAKAATSSSATR